MSTILTGNLVYVVVLRDRHFDDVVTLHRSQSGCEARVVDIKQDYAEQMQRYGCEWRWDARSSSWRAFDDGPSITVEKKELLP